MKNTIKIKLTILILTFFVSNFSFGQNRIEGLKVDTTITGFHFAGDFQGTSVYTKNGPSDLKTINPTAFSFTIAPNMAAEVGKEQLDMLFHMSVQNGYKISELIKKDTMVNGNIGYYISYTETDEKESYKNSVFNAFVIKNKTLILFTSGDLDKGKYFDQFRRTFYSIKI